MQIWCLFSIVTAEPFLHQVFPVESKLNATEPWSTFLQVEGNWRGDENSDLALATMDGDCSSAAYVHNKQFNRSRLVFEVEIPLEASPRQVCFRENGGAPVRIGELKYYPAPIVNQPRLIPFKVHVKVFLNPGWSLNIPVQCSNCTAYNVLAIKAPKMCKIVSPFEPVQPRKNLGPRYGMGPNRVQYNVVTKPCSDPCHGFLDDDLIAAVSLEDASDTFRFVSDDRFPSSQRMRATLKHLCFYSNNQTFNGTHVGNVDFLLDSKDMQAFVIFIIFFGVAMPVICIVTVLLHFNKYRRCRLRQREVQVQVQRVQLEEELIRRTRDAEARG